MAIKRKFEAYFVSNFHSGDFGYVLYPFLRIYKIFGFVPIKLKCGEILRHRLERVEWQWSACVWTFISSVAYIVGFACGLHGLGHIDAPMKRHGSTAIAHTTSWAQIVTLFTLGSVALITSWTQMDNMRRLCMLIFKIDQKLRSIADIKIDYQQLRKRLLREFSLEFVICFSLSMVNCIVIQPSMEKLSIMSNCFWFICFLPLMLITFKEFQFYNFMFILKSKYDLVNAKLLSMLPPDGSGHKRIVVLQKLQSVSEIPLTAVTTTANSTASSSPRLNEGECPNVETLQQLLEIYSNVGDAIELTLRIFSWHLLLLTVVSFGVITVESYNLFATISHALHMQPYQIFFIIAWILVQVLAIGINVSACSMTAKTMSTTVSVLHKLKAQTHADVGACVFYQVLQLFSLEILQRKSIFTAAGFFDMNYKLITSIVGAVTTYLVIIIQFHLTNIPDCHYGTPPPPAA